MDVTIRMRIGNDEVPESAEPHDLLKGALHDSLAHLRLHVGDDIYVAYGINIE
ncbi:hypothetical protein ACWEU6_12900 [Streptosporangium sandarakinum]|uniref:hypothetical protein n=1 Tax=Streptosporangium sandarakinum TaxID=1260955 RepID=UPI00368367B6